MERSPVDLMPRAHLIGNVVIWSIATLLFIGSALLLEYRRLESRFDTIVNDLSHHIGQQLQSREMVLESFAHYLSTLPQMDLSRTREFAARLHQHGPDFYMLALASRVPATERPMFEERMRERESRGFNIHPLHENETPASPAYYPVVLLEPEVPVARALLGMDMVQEASALSGLLNGKTDDRGISRPIALDDSRGYLLYHAIKPDFTDEVAHGAGDYGHYALLVIRAEALLPGWALDLPGLSLRLRHPDTDLGDRGLLLEHRQEGHRLLPLPPFERVMALSDEEQPLQLELSYLPPWQVLDVWLLLGVLGGGLLLILQGGWVVLRVVKARHRLLDQQKSLYEKAHYDHLTGLPNTNLLIDRLEQAIRSAQRTASRVAVFFLDLDDFKRVNDLWGHDVGDQLLIQIGVRLRESMRGEDTVARIHGDEFVILLPVLDSESQLNKVRDKLEQLFAIPFRVGDIELTQSGSIGLAVYPDDADEAEGLLGLADRQMYLHKQAKDRGEVDTAVGS